MAGDAYYSERTKDVPDDTIVRRKPLRDYGGADGLLWDRKAFTQTDRIDNLFAKHEARAICDLLHFTSKTRSPNVEIH